MVFHTHPTAALTINDLQEVNGALHGVRRRWYYIGLELNLDSEELITLREEYDDKFTKCLDRMLQMWLKRRDPPATWQALVDALKERTVDEEGVAMDIAKKYLK